MAKVYVPYCPPDVRRVNPKEYCQFCQTGLKGSAVCVNPKCTPKTWEDMLEFCLRLKAYLLQFIRDPAGMKSMEIVGDASEARVMTVLQDMAKRNEIHNYEHHPYFAWMDKMGIDFTVWVKVPHHPKTRLVGIPIQVKSSEKQKLEYDNNPKMIVPCVVAQGDIISQIRNIIKEYTNGTNP